MKIISLNIEFDKHLDLILPFFKKESPDVLLLQEILEENLEFLKRELDMSYCFTPLVKVKFPKREKVLGIATLSRFKFVKSGIYYYFGDSNVLPKIEPTEPEKMNRAILSVTVEKGNQKFMLINTHFTWTPSGNPNLRQRVHLANLLKILSGIPEFVLCGDFNAPRGREIFDSLAKIYKDNIPQNVTTTIDKNLHIAGDLQIVVDGLFTTRGYGARNVRVINGVSDHFAVAAEIYKV